MLLLNALATRAIARRHLPVRHRKKKDTCTAINKFFLSSALPQPSRFACRLNLYQKKIDAPWCSEPDVDFAGFAAGDRPALLSKNSIASHNSVRLLRADLFNKKPKVIWGVGT